MTAIAFPISRFQAVADGARAHIAKAAYELHTGRREQAEITVREVISAGFLMMDEDPTLIGNLIGVVIIGTGGDALESLYRATGRGSEAALLVRIQDELEAAYSSREGERSTLIDIEGSTRSAARTVQNEEMLRGLRWEFLPPVTFFSPCLNMHMLVFGPEEDYRSWLKSVHNSLVRYPSEEALFELVVNNFFVSQDSLKRRGFWDRMLSIAAGSSKAGNCPLMLQFLPR